MLYRYALLTVLLGVSGTVLIGVVEGVYSAIPLGIGTAAAAWLAVRFRAQGV